MKSKNDRLNQTKLMTVYHYTSGSHLDLILESKMLKVSHDEIKRKVRPPALWVSTNETWEMTATKMLSDGINIFPMTMEEMHEKIGLVRFILIIKKEKLCSWHKYKYKSNTPENFYNSMTAAGIKKGGNPDEWFAIFENIPLKRCISCQKWDGKNWITTIQFNDQETFIKNLI